MHFGQRSMKILWENLSKSNAQYIFDKLLIPQEAFSWTEILSWVGIEYSFEESFLNFFGHEDEGVTIAKSNEFLSFALNHSPHTVGVAVVHLPEPRGDTVYLVRLGRSLQIISRRSIIITNPCDALWD